MYGSLARRENSGLWVFCLPLDGLLTCPLVRGVWQLGEGAGTAAVRVPWQAYSRHFALEIFKKNQVLAQTGPLPSI